MLALDEPNELDTTAEEKGYAFCMEKNLLGQVKNVVLDYSVMGFSLTPSTPLQGAGGCSSCSVNGGCSGS